MAYAPSFELVLKWNNEVIAHTKATHPLAEQFTEDTRRLRRHIKRNAESDIRRAWRNTLKDRDSNASKAIRGEYHQIYAMPWPWDQTKR